MGDLHLPRYKDDKNSASYFCHLAKNRQAWFFMPCCDSCEEGHSCEGDKMADPLAKAIACAIPAVLYDTVYRGSSISQALPLAATVGVTSAISDILTRNFVGPMLGYEPKFSNALVNGGLFYAASKQMNLFSYGTSTLSMVAEGALYNIAGSMIYPTIQGLLSGGSSGTPMITLPTLPPLPTPFSLPINQPSNAAPNASSKNTVPTLPTYQSTTPASVMDQKNAIMAQMGGKTLQGGYTAMY